MKYRFYARRINYDSAFEIHIVAKDENGKTYHAKPLEFVEIDRETVAPATIQFRDYEFDLQDNPAQHLLDTLVNAGLKPGGFTRAAEDNLKLHLQDMRVIVSKKLGVELK